MAKHSRARSGGKHPGFAEQKKVIVAFIHSNSQGHKQAVRKPLKSRKFFPQRPLFTRAFPPYRSMLAFAGIPSLLCNSSAACATSC